MGQVVVVGLDIAKSVFQVHGVDRDGAVVVRRRLRRSRVLPFFATVEPYRIGIEAFATGHYWARELRALGHDVRLMVPSYVKPYVKRQKNDAADAEAICEAVGRPTIRFVPVKTPEQQSVMVLHRTCHHPAPAGRSQTWIGGASDRGARDIGAGPAPASRAPGAVTLGCSRDCFLRPRRVWS